MAQQRMSLNYMNLEQAKRIGLRPTLYRPVLWGRALSILMRWAAEPCRQREYNVRLNMCRKVHGCIGAWIERQEKLKARKWKPRKKGR